MSAPTIRCDPRTQYISKVPNDKENEEAPANAAHRNRSDLTDHGVEGEGHHGGCTDASGSDLSVEDFRGIDPAQRAHCGGERKVEDPCRYDECPMGLVVGA